MQSSSNRHIFWPRAVRVVPSRFPPVGLFDRVAEPADLEAVYHVESLTNPRLRQEWGELSLVPAADRIAGPGTTPIMAAFTHPAPTGSRFSPGDYGVYYAAREEDTAIAETVFHRERFLQYSKEKPLRLQMRMYVGEIEAELVDIRGMQDALPDLYDRNSYVHSQPFGASHRANQAWGIVYDSVRHAFGECVAIFRPPAARPVRQSKHLEYIWNGFHITDVLAISPVASWR